MRILYLFFKENSILAIDWANESDCQLKLSSLPSKGDPVQQCRYQFDLTPCLWNIGQFMYV